MTTSCRALSSICLATAVLTGCVSADVPTGASGAMAGTPAHAGSAANSGKLPSASSISAPTLPTGLVPSVSVPGSSSCLLGSPAQAEGCPCRAGELAACWTGAPADRLRGSCHDGMQKCVGSADAEFGTWGPCEGQELKCGDTPGCGCVPGAEISCDEDCSVTIFCSLTATKTCQPDGTWGACHEQPGVTSPVAALGDAGLGALFADGGVGQLLAADGGLNIANVSASLGPILGDAGVALLTTGPCRSLFFGCSSVFGMNEQWVGDCSKAFTCQKPPQ